MSDYDNWLVWTRKNRNVAGMSDEELKAKYDNYYNCNCESCERRKELGMMPIRLNPGCTTPLRQLDG